MEGPWNVPWCLAMFLPCRKTLSSSTQLSHKARMVYMAKAVCVVRELVCMEMLLFKTRQSLSLTDLECWLRHLKGCEGDHFSYSTAMLFKLVYSISLFSYVSLQIFLILRDFFFKLYFELKFKRSLDFGDSGKLLLLNYMSRTLLL